MARERTPVGAWMGTLDEVDFCPYIYPVRNIFFIKREGASESIFLVVVVAVKDKKGEDC
jgi:hypothetical protein